MRNRIILLLIGFMCYAGMGNAQEDKTEKAVAGGNRAYETSHDRFLIGAV